MKKIDKQLSYAPAEFRVSYCGWASPAKREMNGIFRQQLALLCYDQAKSVKELSEALQTPYEYIQDALDSFCNAKMMKKIDGKYLTIFPMLHLKKNYEAGLLCYKFSEEHEIPKKINDILFSLKDKIAALDFYGNDFDLSYLNWFLYTITDNCMISEFRSYFSDKTDEVIFNNSDWRTNNYNYSLCASHIIMLMKKSKMIIWKDDLHKLQPIISIMVNTDTTTFLITHLSPAALKKCQLKWLRNAAETII